MRDSANKHRRHVEFKVGDLVLLKLQPYRQHSVARPQSAKLARRYYGPFSVIERIGLVAYKLRLPEGSRIHNVFHVGLLRPFMPGDMNGVAADLPTEFFGDRPVVYPVRVLDKQMLWHEGQPREHVLVRWSDGTESPTWEPLEVIKQRFSNVLLEDKDVAFEGGVDTVLQPEQPQPAVDGGSAPSRRSEEPSIAKSKPKRNVRPPERLGDYVSR